MDIKTHILSVENANIEQELNRIYLNTYKAHSFKAGMHYFNHFISEIFEAVENQKDLDIIINSAINSGVPEGLIKTALQYAHAGHETIPGFDVLETCFEDMTSDYSQYRVFAPDRFFETALTGGSYRGDNSAVHDIRASKIWSRIVHYIWQGIRIQLVTQDHLLSEEKAEYLDLGNFVSQDGDIYFEMLAETIQNLKTDEIIVKGLFDALKTLGADLKTNHATALALLAYIQGQAAIKDGNLLPADNIQKIADSISGCRGQDIKRPYWQDKATDENLLNRVQNCWHQIEIQLKKGAVTGARVSIDSDDLYAHMSAFSLKEKITFSAAAQSVLCGCVPTSLIIEPEADIDMIRQIIIEAWGQGMQFIDIFRLRSGWDEPLLSTDLRQFGKADAPLNIKSEVC